MTAWSRFYTLAAKAPLRQDPARDRKPACRHFRPIDEMTGARTGWTQPPAPKVSGVPLPIGETEAVALLEHHDSNPHSHLKLPWNTSAGVGQRFNGIDVAHCLNGNTVYSNGVFDACGITSLKLVPYTHEHWLPWCHDVHLPLKLSVKHKVMIKINATPPFTAEGYSQTFLPQKNCFIHQLFEKTGLAMCEDLCIQGQYAWA